MDPSRAMRATLISVVVFVAFVGLTLWVFNGKRNPEFAEARLLPFADEPQPDSTQEPVTRSTRS